MSTTAGIRRGRVLAGGAAAIAVVAALGVGVAFGYFLSTDSSHPAAAIATSLGAPSSPTATESTATSAVITWSNPTGQPPGTAYTVTQGSTTVCANYAASPCTANNLTPGTPYTFSVTAGLDNWTSAPASTATYTPMAVAITYPANNTTYGNGTAWSGTISGSASPANGTTLSAVAVSIQQSGAGCWTGSGATFTAACPNYITASGTTNWTLGLPPADLTSGGSYTVTAQASDSKSVTATSSPVGFNYSAMAPTASAPAVTATQTFGTNPTWTDGQNVAFTDSPATNGGTSIASVAYYYCTTATCNSSNWTAIGPPSTGSPWSVTWSSLPADGTYYVVAVATNAASVTSPVSSATEVGIDTTPPTVSTPNVNTYS